MESAQPEEKFIDKLVKWILENVDGTDVPNDEGNDDALKYNLVHLAVEGKGYKHYEYLPRQDAEIEKWYSKE